MVRQSSLVAVLACVLAACSSASTPTAHTAIPATPAPAATPSSEPSESPVATAAPTLQPRPSSEPAAWRELAPIGPAPAPREDGTWTVAPGTRTAFLFGGRDGSTVFDDLWAFDLADERWTELTPGGDAPRERFGHEAVWVDGFGIVVYAGQAGPTTFFDDLWAYDPGEDRWRALPVAGARPKARYGTCAALGPDGRLWISHGFTEDGTRFADTQAYDFDAGRWTDETPDGRAPVNRCLHGCWWTDDGRFALYAGQTTGVTALGDLWTLAAPGTSSAAWRQESGDLPPDRNLYAFTRLRERVLITGGRALDGTFLDDSFAFDSGTLAVETIEQDGTMPSARAGAMLVDDAHGGRAVLFGGKNDDGALGDLWELPLPRRAAAPALPPQDVKSALGSLT